MCVQRRNSLTTPISNKICDFAGQDLSLDDFEKGAILGKGSFGLVSHMKSKKNGKYYAMKAMSKQALVEMDQVPHVLNEALVGRKLTSRVAQRIRYPAPYACGRTRS